MKTLIIRVISAGIGVLILFLSYHFGGRDGLALLCSLGAVAFATEFSNLLPGGKSTQWVFILLSVTLLYVGLFAEELFFLELGLSFVLITLIVLARVGKRFTLEAAFQQLSFMGFGLLYCAVLPIFVFKILYSGESPTWFVLYLCLVFVGDTVAYIVGNVFGKTKLFELVSPKKSVEGALAGLLATIIVGMISTQYFEVSIYQIFFCSLAVGCVAQAGDLIESLLKRAAHVKDSGKLMPGHGGMMDRLDGVYFASPVFYWFLRGWLNQ